MTILCFVVSHVCVKVSEPQSKYKHGRHISQEACSSIFSAKSRSPGGIRSSQRAYDFDKPENIMANIWADTWSYQKTKTSGMKFQDPATYRGLSTQRVL